MGFSIRDEGDTFIFVDSEGKDMSLQQEKKTLLEFMRRGNEMRAQYKTRDGFWGTGLRNDYDENNRSRRSNHWELPQGTEDHEREGVPDIWPRIGSKEWMKTIE